MAMSMQDRPLGTVEGTLEEVRSRLNTLEIRFNRSGETRFYVLLGATVAVMLTMWVTIILAVVLRT
jgi:hypothetical protein